MGQLSPTYLLTLEASVVLFGPKRWLLHQVVFCAPRISWVFSHDGLFGLGLIFLGKQTLKPLKWKVC